MVQAFFKVNLSRFPCSGGPAVNLSCFLGFWWSYGKSLAFSVVWWSYGGLPGRVLGLLGPSGVHFGSFRASRGLLELIVGLLGPFGRLRGPPGASLGRLRGPPGALLGSILASWGPLWAPPGPLWGLLGPPLAARGAPRGSKSTKNQQRSRKVSYFTCF